MTTKTATKTRARKLQAETGLSYAQCLRCVECVPCQSEPDTPGPGCGCMHAPCLHDVKRRQMTGPT